MKTNATKAELLSLISQVRNLLPDEPESAVAIIDSAFKENEVVAMSDFDFFWRLYPIKPSKKMATQAWNNALLRGADPQQMIRGADFMKQGVNMVKTGKIRFFPVPYPTTFLNQNRFEQEAIDSMKRQYFPTNASSTIMAMAMVQGIPDNPEEIGI